MNINDNIWDYSLSLLYNILLIVDQGFCHSFKDGPLLQVRHG